MVFRFELNSAEKWENKMELCRWDEEDHRKGEREVRGVALKKVTTYRLIA